MNKQVSEKFENLWEFFPDELTSDKKYQFKKGNFLDGYCGSNSCDNDSEKISAGFFYLLNGFFGDSNSFNFDEKSKNDIFYYTIIWLSYMLNLKDQVGTKTNLQYFYDIDISNQNRYTNPIAGFTEYTSYKDLLDKKKIVNMDIKAISKLYVPFKSLCNMYYGFKEGDQKCNNYLNDDNEFFKKYKELKDDSSITNDSSCSQILSALSTDYNKLKEKCKNDKSGNIPSPSEITTDISTQSSLSSSIGNKLFIVLSIFGAIGFFLGISYKYSLFGFRKRFQKQKLREKLKN
ncbi:YIR protein, partial [Plasmodium yoelii]